MAELRSACVFCGSSSGRDPQFAAAAETLGTLLAQREIKLVYGGASVGLMGTLADAALAAGGEVIGVIPRDLFKREIAHRGVTELHEVDTMHARKALMYDVSDAFIALPGGFGTLDEMFEVLTWSQLGLHAKPAALLDIAGFWQPLVGQLDHMVSAGLLRPENRAMVTTCPTPEAALDHLATAEVVTTEKWIGPEDR